MKKPTTTQCFAIGAALLCATSTSYAADITYTGTDNAETNWNVGTNWSSGSLPTSADTAIINQNRTTFVDSAVNFGGTLTNQNSAAGSTSVVDVRTGGTLAVSLATNGTASGGDGVINVTGGTMTAGSEIINHGTINLSSGTLSLFNNASGSNGDKALAAAGGILNVTGGALIAGANKSGGNLSFRSSVVISGGSFTTTGSQTFFTDGASLTINGDAATIGFDSLVQNRAARAADFNFNFGATGVSAVGSSGFMSIWNATINVDGSGYTGGAAVFDLFTSSSFLDLDSNDFATMSTVAGFAGLDGVVSVSGNNLILTLTTIPEPGTYALLAGLTGLVWVMVRRRR